MGFNKLIVNPYIEMSFFYELSIVQDCQNDIFLIVWNVGDY
jgi:hypothetical protein